MEFTELLQRYLNENNPSTETVNCLAMLSRVVLSSGKHIFQEVILWAYDEGHKELK